MNSNNSIRKWINELGVTFDKNKKGDRDDVDDYKRGGVGLWEIGWNLSLSYQEIFRNAENMTNKPWNEKWHQVQYNLTWNLQLTEQIYFTDLII